MKNIFLSITFGSFKKKKKELLLVKFLSENGKTVKNLNRVRSLESVANASKC